MLQHTNCRRIVLSFCSVAVLLHSAAAQTSTVNPPADAVELNPFIVTTSTNEGYLSSSAAAAGRVAQQLENIPQQISIYNAAFLQDIQFTTFQDALRYDSSTSYNSSGFNSASTMIRGFATPNPLRNGVEGGNFGNPLAVEAIEQVEIVKGAAAVLYGPSQPGGVVNYVTKRPQFQNQNTAEFEAYSTGGSRSSLDLTGPVGLKDKDGREVLAYRLVLAHEGRDLYQINNQSQSRDSQYGAITYQPFRGLTIDAQVENDRRKTSFFNSDTIIQSVVTGLANGTYTPQTAPLPYNTFPGGAKWTYQDTGGYAEEHDKYAQVSVVLSHDFGTFGDWTLRTLYTWSESALFRLLDDIGSGYYPQSVTTADIGKVVNFSQVVSAADVTAGRLWIPARYIRQIDGFPNDNLNTQWDLTGKVRTGPLKHTLLIGSDADLGSNTRSGIAGVASIEKQAYVGAAGTGNAIWVDSPDLRPITNINWNDIRSAANPNGIVTSGNITTGTGRRADLNNNLRLGVPWLTVPAGGNYDKNLYIFDAISLLDERLQLSLGARYDEIGQYVAPSEFSASHWTYRYGAVFKLLPQMQLFALDNESFLPNSAAASQAFGRFISPQQGKQVEGGVRFSLFDKRLLVSASIYKIDSTNVVQNNPYGNVGVVPPIPANNYAFVPGISNKGVDLDATINLTASTQLVASYSHYDIMNAAGPTQLAQGITEYPVNNVPNNQVAAWAKYTVPSSVMRGLSFNAGYRYVGYMPGGSTGAVPALYLPGYGITDAGIGYTRGRWSLSLLTRNVFNKFAFRDASSSTRLYPEEPRSTSVTLRVKF